MLKGDAYLLMQARQQDQAAGWMWLPLGVTARGGADSADPGPSGSQQQSQLTSAGVALPLQTHPHAAVLNKCSV